METPVSLPEDARSLIESYVTNLDDDVFAIHGLPGLVGAVMARYSRAETGLRETLLREFVKEDRLKLKKASRLIERVLIAYGDDSVGELEGAHLSFERISMLATKVIEHRRIGGSPIEQSTRYIRFDYPDEDGRYRYHVPAGVRGTAHQETYERLMDRIFDGYREMWEPTVRYLESQKSLESAVYDIGSGESLYEDQTDDKSRAAFERTWRNDIKTKACDVMRGFLPLATLANVGLFGNGRYFQHLISKLWTSNLDEANELGTRAHEELSKVIPHYVKRARRLDYTRANDRAMQALAARHFQGLDNGPATELVEPDNAFTAERLAEAAASGSLNAETVRAARLEEEHLSFLASLVYPHARGSYRAVRARLAELPEASRQEVMDAYYGTRRTRRDRPERGLEHGYPHLYDMVTEWGVYKDLMRHRMATIQVQALVPDMGFEMPAELEAAGTAAIGKRVIAAAEELYAYLDEHVPAAREYAFLQGHRMRWMIGINDRALMHMLELRTTPQGHTNYRLASQEMHRLLERVRPERAARMTFVNHDPVYWSREASEAYQRVKEARLGEDGEG